MLANPLLPALVGVLGAVIGAVLGALGNNLLTRAREERTFVREKKLELYLEILAEDDSFRSLDRYAGNEEQLREKLKEARAAEERRAILLNVRCRLFASGEVYRRLADCSERRMIWGNYVLMHQYEGRWPAWLLAREKSEELVRAIAADLGSDLPKTRTD